MIFYALACTSAPPAPPKLAPDEPTTTAAIEALCKVIEGADVPCERGADQIRFGSTTVGVHGSLYPVESSLGIATLRGSIRLTGTDPDWSTTTRLRGFGSGRSEALERSIHEWALVSGTAIAQTWEGVSGALTAVEPSATPVSSPFPGFDVTRGWTLYQPRGQLDHDVLLKALAPAFAGRSPAGTISVEITHQGSSLTADCWFDGEVDEALCREARAWNWPVGDYELRTAYFVQPSKGAPPAP